MDQKIYFCIGFDSLGPSTAHENRQPTPKDAAEDPLLIDLSAQIYGIYLSFFSKDDIHVSAIDEAFIDVTGYLGYYKQTPEALARTAAERIYAETEKKPFCGIGTNLYLAKIAMDSAKKGASEDITQLTEESYIEKFWDHSPMTDFWGIDKKTEARLCKLGIHTMRELANANEDTLYRTFGPDAELLIDHARGKESATIRDIKKYKTKLNSLTGGQVLMRDYNYDEGREIVRAMMEKLCDKLQDHTLATNALRLCVGYEEDANRPVSRGDTTLPRVTNAKEEMVRAITDLYNRIALSDFPIRRIWISCDHVESAFFLEEETETCATT